MRVLVAVALAYSVVICAVGKVAACVRPRGWREVAREVPE